MEGSESTVTCAVTIEWLTSQGSINRKVTHKTATLRLIRNEFQEIFVQVSNEKCAPHKFKIKDISVHKKFMTEGKASIKFQETNCTVFLSNAPPSNLIGFLRTLFIKMTGEKESNANPASKNQNLRAQLLSSKPKSFEDISPVTLADLQKAKNQISKSTTTTPSPPTKKRKLIENGVKIPASKKLYIPSPLYVTASLNEEQQKVLDACLGGRNVFFTGSAGTGKSFLLKKIISALPPDVTMSTASTGVAACHISGTTLHAFAGIGGGDAAMEQCFKMASKPVVAQKWRKCRHLVIDEISMVDGNYFEKIEEIARRVRNNDKPFGGIQLILCGDFLQLPPIVSKNEQKVFCFQSKAWDKCIEQSFELQIVHRQKDSQFVSILNSIRIGRVTEEITERLVATSKQKIESEGILATRLCTHTNDSNLINESKLKQLEGEEKIFSAQDSEPYSASQLDAQTGAPSKLTLKLQAQVMLLKNINVSAGLVNGARGIVIRFEEGLPVVRFKNLKEFVVKSERWVVKTSSGTLISRRQIPLNLAWAFSIHKSQGLTLDCVEMSLSKIFEAGQAYVALSRAQSLESLRVLDFDSKQVWANPTVLEFYQKFRRRLQQTEIVPLGRSFTNKNKMTTFQALTNARSKISKKISNKPLVNIC